MKETLSVFTWHFAGQDVLLSRWHMLLWLHKSVFFRVPEFKFLSRFRLLCLGSKVRILNGVRIWRTDNTNTFTSDILKSSWNKKDLNDVTAAPFLVFFCCWQLRKRLHNWCSCGVNSTPTSRTEPPYHARYKQISQPVDQLIELNWVINEWWHRFGSVVCGRLFLFSMNQRSTDQWSEPVLQQVLMSSPINNPA